MKAAFPMFIALQYPDNVQDFLNQLSGLIGSPVQNTGTPLDGGSVAGIQSAFPFDDVEKGRLLVLQLVVVKEAPDRPQHGGLVVPFPVRPTPGAN